MPIGSESSEVIGGGGALTSPGNTGPPAPVAAQAKATNLRTCDGCDADFANQLGADFAVSGWVQKVSNLILNMNIMVRDAKTGRVISLRSVDMRGNTDETWSRAIDWLVHHDLLAPPGQGVF